MNIPELYQIIGVRFEGLINGFMGADKSEVDASTRGRLGFVDFGIYLFQKKPILGYGVATFEHLHEIIFTQNRYHAYSHNNYIELLVGIGLIGTILYYSIYVYLLLKIRRLLRIKKDPLLAFLFSILVCLLFIHYGLVAYYELFFNIIITFIAAITNYYSIKLDNNTG